MQTWKEASGPAKVLGQLLIALLQSVWALAVSPCNSTNRTRPKHDASVTVTPLPQATVNSDEGIAG